MKAKSILNKKIDRVKSFSLKSPELLFPNKVLQIRLENGLNLLFEGERIPNLPNKQRLRILEHALIVVNRHNMYTCRDIIIKDSKIINVGYISENSVETMSSLLQAI